MVRCLCIGPQHQTVMTRCIYVGHETPALCYGRTGWFEWERTSMQEEYPVFYPDDDGGPYYIGRSCLYVPSQDQTRHCPKP